MSEVTKSPENCHQSLVLVEGCYQSDHTCRSITQEMDCFDVLNLIFLNNCTFLGTFGINTAAPSVGTTLAVQGDVALDNLVTLEMTFNL